MFELLLAEASYREEGGGRLRSPWLERCGAAPGHATGSTPGRLYTLPSSHQDAGKNGGRRADRCCRPWQCFCSPAAGGRAAATAQNGGPRSAARSVTRTAIMPKSTAWSYKQWHRLIFFQGYSNHEGTKCLILLCPLKSCMMKIMPSKCVEEKCGRHPE